jgi:hypothetical protein
MFEIITFTITNIFIYKMVIALWMLAILYCIIYHVDNDIFMLSVIFISMFCIVLL